MESFEKKLKQLEKIVEKLGSGELSLQESLKSFEQGIKLSRECSKELDQSEQKVKKLIQDNKGRLKTVDFESVNDNETNEDNE